MMELENYHAFHFVGLGGVGMCALARILIEKGITVSGSDVSDSAVLQELRNKGAAVFIGHKRENINNADVLVVSSAIGMDNPELQEAKSRDLPIFHRSDVLAAIFKWGKGIAVAEIGRAHV